MDMSGRSGRWQVGMTVASAVATLTLACSACGSGGQASDPGSGGGGAATTATGASTKTSGTTATSPTTPGPTVTSPTTPGPSSTVTTTTVPTTIPATSSTTAGGQGSVRQLTQADNGHTITVKVGDVLMSPPLALDYDRANPIRSSDPKVVGVVGSAVGELIVAFRARHAGEATITRPTIACGFVGAGRESQCPRPWWVKVIVRA
jgi:hypothetical protein